MCFYPKGMMKIIAINGSHTGKRGYTHFLIEKLFNGAKQEGAECEEITLAKLKINICKGCSVCNTEKHLLKCIYEEKDDVTMIFNKMREADIIIYATPIYVFNMSGLMKVFLDRMNATGNSEDFKLSESGLFFHHISRDICSKPFVTLICHDNFENEMSKNVVSYFRTFSKFMDAPQIGTIIRRLGKLTGYGKDSEKEKQYPKILESYKAIEFAGKELVTKGKISKKTQKTASRDIIPIPFFSILKNFKAFKKKALEKLKTE
ncbi:MAG: flavodoxin family protein [Bacteroidales bacterium]|nr:flavodoxin family protein [Bacteroidales bacterium]